MRGVTRRSTSAGSRPSVRSSMSAKTGRAPTRRTALALETKVNEGQMTSWPGPMPEGQQRELERVRARGRQQDAGGAEQRGEARLDAAADGAVARGVAGERLPHRLLLPRVEPGPGERDRVGGSARSRRYLNRPAGSGPAGPAGRDRA